MNQDSIIRAVCESDRTWVEELLVDRWGALSVAVHQTLYMPADLAGFVAEMAPNGFAEVTGGPDHGTLRAGLVTYVIDGDDCEIVTLDSLVSGSGVGTSLVGAVRRAARLAGCGRVWLVTTNDNRHAVRFYERRGFRLRAVHVGAVAEARRLKPEIPLVGLGGVPIRDELEFDISP